MNDGLYQLLDYICRFMAAKGTLYVYIARDPNPKMLWRRSGDTKSEETKTKELRQKGWNFILKKESGVGILEGFD
jgi:hypothetical protein